MNKKHIRVVSAAIERDGCYLITQRQAGAVLPLLWEFPGGKVEPGEADQDALRRELRFRLGVAAKVADKISTTEREYSDYVVELHLYACDIGAEEPRPLNVKTARWVKSEEFANYTFTPADEASMNALLAV